MEEVDCSIEEVRHLYPKGSLKPATTDIYKESSHVQSVLQEVSYSRHSFRALGHVL